MADPKLYDPDQKPEMKLPEGFDSEEDFLADMRRMYDDDIVADLDNRKEALEDHRFVAGYQWDEPVYQRRLNNKKPALTINRLPAFVSQVVGNRRLNDLVINVIPDQDRYKEGAKIRKELIRSIQKNSNAKRAYDNTYQNQFIGGEGNFEVVLDYTSDDVFEQDIKIQGIENPHAVVWDRLSVDPTGADASHVFVTDRISRRDFKDRWPDKVPTNFQTTDALNQELERQGWINKDTVRIAAFWRILTEKRTLALMQDGETNDITDLIDAGDTSWMETVVIDRDGAPTIREVNKRYAQKYLVSGNAILEGPYNLPIKRVPVFRAVGWQINVGEYRSRFGGIRFLRDPQRLHNYWRSVIAEKLMQSPKQTWLAEKDSVKGREKEFRESHLSMDNLLIWNGDGGDNAKPEQIQPVQMEPALINEAGIAAQDIRDISNIHEASLGQQSNEVSGQAILARQRVSELGTVQYQENMNMAIEEAGRVINDLIPFVYDTPRVLKIAGDSPEDVQFISVNYDENPESIDITAGKYSITSTTGPSFETKRVESRESMMAAVNAMPDSFGSVADLIAEAQDWPGADKMADRIKRTMPPEILGQDMTPEQQQAQQAQAQAAQRQAQIAEAQVNAQIEKDAMQALKFRAEAVAKMAEAGLSEDRARAEIEKIYAEIAKIGADIESQDINDSLNTINTLAGEKDDGRDDKDT